MSEQERLDKWVYLFSVADFYDFSQLVSTLGHRQEKSALVVN